MLHSVRVMCAILKRLWRGEKVSYSGPAGNYTDLALNDPYDGPSPQIWYGTWGLAKAAKAVASPAFDGVLLIPMLTPDAVHAARKRMDQECERIGRDPRTLRICACVVTAPELDDGETRELCHARAVTYLQPPAWGHSYTLSNGWAPAIMDRMRHHGRFAKLKDGLADSTFHRTQLNEPAKLIPDSWMKECCAIGSIADCVKTIKAFRDAGSDEVTTYGSTPGQNAKLIAAWREHRKQN